MKTSTQLFGLLLCVSLAGTPFNRAMAQTGNLSTLSSNRNDKDASTASGSAPVADFTTCNYVVEMYEPVQMQDLSSNAPTSWEWDVYDSVTYISSGYVASLANGDLYSDPNADGSTEFTSHAAFGFQTPGLYTVVLKATNAFGTSTIVKKNYVRVVDITQYFLGFGTYGKNGDNFVEANHGGIIDDGGPFLNYTNGQGIPTKSFLSISPQARKPVTIEFSQVRLGDQFDSILLFDGPVPTMSNLMAVLTSADNGTYPTYTTTSSSLFFYFSSNGSGNDSGYQARFYADGFDTGGIIKPLVIAHDTLAVNKSLKFYPEDNTWVIERGLKVWTVDGIEQIAYRAFDTLVHEFSDTVNHTVCLEVKNCDTNMSACERLVFDRHTGIHKVSISPAVKVYPNPGSGIYNVNVPASVIGQGTMLQVYNLLGELVTERNAADTAIQIDLSAEPVGIYWLRLSGSQTAAMVIKQ